MRHSATLTITTKASLPVVLDFISDPMAQVELTGGFMGPWAEATGAPGEIRVESAAMGGYGLVRVDRDDVREGVEVHITPDSDAGFDEPARIRLLRNGEGTDVLWNIRSAANQTEEDFAGSQAGMTGFMQLLKERLDSL